MTDKTHQMIGLTAATAIFLTTNPTPVTVSIAASVIIGSFIGSLAPDIDQPTASLWRNIPLGGVWGRIVAECLGGHRNLSHSILGTFLFALLMNWLVQFIPPGWGLDSHLVFSSFLIGFIAHLVADSVTVMGIPLLWPFGRNMGFPPYPFDGIRIITGKWFENLVILPLVTLSFIALVISYGSHFCAIFPPLCK
ncbi:MAG TPA: metal-dependent hydrolase [Patescibacteria group bacterium]